MHFERLYIYRSGDKLLGTIEFTNELGKISLNLSDDLSQRLLILCGEALVEISEKAAQEMSAKVIEAVTPLAIGSPERAKP